MKTAVIILIVIAALLIIYFIACAFIFNQLIWRKQLPVPKFILNLIAGNNMPDKYESDAHEAVKDFKKLPIEKVELKESNGMTLAGRVLVPKKSNGKLMLLCHGARSSGIGEFCFIGPRLYNDGYTLVFPDHRGCGDSDGKFMGYGTHESKDTFLWLDYAEKRFPELDIFILGVSMGAATVLMMSENAVDKKIKGIIADCPYTSAWEEFSYQMKTSFHMPEFPILYTCDLYSRIFAHYSFKDASPLNAVKNSKKPILFIHGAADDFVPVYMQKKLYDACPNEKYMLTVEGAVHARSYYTNSDLYYKKLTDFIDRYSKQTQTGN